MSANLIQPTLQRADGSYIGTDGTNTYAFTASGSPLWTVPNDTPQVATADRGVIGASGITYDENGNATGQLTSLPTYSWIGNAYQLGSVELVAFGQVNLANTFAALLGGNASDNSTAIKQQQPYPPLASCTNTSMKCPAQAI
jgi:hypothetical protein